MNTTGIFFGLFTFVAIGLGFVWVIKLEYYVGAHAARAVAALGVAVTLLSLFVPHFVWSAVLGVLGGTIVWGAMELPAQAERVAQGMFPANPRKRAQKEAVPAVLAEGEGNES
jgi:hypothetical protein